PVPPAAVPTVRSAAPASPTYAQTACAAAWPAAAADARSRAPARSVARVVPGSALAAHPREEHSDRGAPPLTCAEYRMKARVFIPVRAKKVVQRISLVTPTAAAPTSAPAAASRCLPAASITAPASAKPCHSQLAAKRIAHAPVASRTNTTRRRRTTGP